MSGLALIAKRLGATVTASDKNDTPYLRKLSEKQIPVWVGSVPERIPKGAEVFYSSAIKPDDPERAYAEKNGFFCAARHSLLERITRNYFTIAIAGCHGKTTSSAWVAYLLTLAGYDPTALVGGTVVEWNSNLREGNGTMQGKPLLVIEADESDRSFLAIDTRVALVTNIDLDHTDVHADLPALTADFLQFARSAQAKGGWLHISKEAPSELFALLSASEQKVWQKISIDSAGHAVAYERQRFSVGLTGEHNLLNATLVLQLGLRLAIPQAIIARALAEFTGVARRMQKIAELPQLALSVIDDYAHHPHEIAATLSALSAQFDRLLIFWEPHRLSRFNHFYREFDAVLRRYAERHAVYVLPLFYSSDREEDYPETHERFAIFRNSPYVFLASPAEFSRTRGAWIGKKNAAVFMGAGKSSEWAQEYTNWLRAHSIAAID